MCDSWWSINLIIPENFFLIIDFRIYWLRLYFFDELFILLKAIGNDFKFLDMKENLRHKELIGLVLTVIKSTFEISKFIFFKQKSID